MERRKNLPVLPSNAPALSPRASILSTQSDDSINHLSSQICQTFNRGHECRVCNLHHICSTCQQPGHGAHSCQAGILRVSSGNAGLTPVEPSIFDHKFRSDSRYDSKPVSTFVNPPYHTAQAAIRVQQKKERRNIWQRWELQSPRYLAYRRKARSKKPGSKEDVWPDDVEEAFQIAIRLYAKRGRTKDELNGRQAGGNEFISDWIEKQTGHRRCRKQISSHIQTLKGFLGDVPSWMDLVTAWPPGKQEKAKAIKQISNASYDDLDFESPTGDGTVQPLHRGNPNIRPPAAAILGSNIAQDPSIRGVQFDMHLSNESTSTKTHIYTSIQSEIGSGPRTLEQVPRWQVLFPHLATRYNEGRIDCPLFLFESRLRLIDDIRLGLSLGIEFAIDFAEGAYFHEWRSLTRVHKQGSIPQYFDDSEFEQTCDRLDCLESGSGQSDIQLTVPFKSKWWVKLFSSIISKRDGARNAKDREAMKWADEYPAAYFRELSIMQELWATPTGGTSQRPQRMAILLWTFNQTRNGEAATTTWRPLTLSTSASPYQVQEPILRSMQPSMNLDSAVQGNIIPESQSASGYYNHQQGPGLFIETSNALLNSQISECNTSATTPVLDYHSFPSSTSASFPSSISNASGFPAHHGSSFDSADGRSYTHSLESSFHSQQGPAAAYPMPDPANATGLPHVKPSESYDSQDILYQSQPGSVYDSINDFHSYDHSQNADDTIVVNPSAQSDFTQGAIHLAYAGAGADQLQRHGDVYEAPLIAPRASMLPQQQLEQHLQNFEHWVPPPSAPGPLSLHSHGQRNHQQQQQQHVQGVLHQQQQQQQPEQSHIDTNNDEHEEDEEGEEEEEEELLCPTTQSSGAHVLTLHAPPAEIETTESAEEEQDDDLHRQQQLQYLHDAQDHWQQSFHPALWGGAPEGLQQLPALLGEGGMDLREDGAVAGGQGGALGEMARGQGGVLGEIRERIEGIQAQEHGPAGRGWDGR